jgi:hypothetical protein
MLRLSVAVLMLCLAGVHAYNEFGGIYSAYTMEHTAMLAVSVFFVFGMAASWLNKGLFVQGMFMTLQTQKNATPKDGSLMTGNRMSDKIEFLLSSITVYSVLWLITDLFLVAAFSFFYLTDGIDENSAWHVIFWIFIIFFMIVVILRHMWPVSVFLDKPREYTLLSGIFADSNILKDYGYKTRRGLGMVLQLIEYLFVVLTFILMLVGLIYNWALGTPFWTLGTGYANTIFGILAIVFFVILLLLMTVNVLFVYTYMTVVQPFTAQRFSAPVYGGYQRVRARIY